MAEWLRRLTRKPKVRTAVGSNPALDSLVTVRNSSPGQPVPCEGNLVAAAGSCGGLMVKHPWPLLEISLSDFHRLATLNINTYLPNQMTRINRIAVQFFTTYFVDSTHNFKSQKYINLTQFIFISNYIKINMRTCFVK